MFDILLALGLESSVEVAGSTLLDVDIRESRCRSKRQDGERGDGVGNQHDC
jgi:hypothetical protein